MINFIDVGGDGGGHHLPANCSQFSLSTETSIFVAFVVVVVWVLVLCFAILVTFKQL